MLLKPSLALACLVAIATPLWAQQERFDAPSTSALLARTTTSGETAIRNEARSVANGKVELEPLDFLLSPEEILRHPNASRRLLGKDVQPGTAARLVWKPSNTFSGMAVETPVLVVNGAYDGPTLCLTAAVHGDELNGIEMVRRVMYELDPGKLRGMVIGVPIVNLLGFSRNSRYLPDRRDLNRFFPGNPRGSVASRIAAAFFSDVVRHCDRLVDLHTGSFYRTNIPQLRADMTNPRVADFVELFGAIPVLSSAGNSRSLRAAAVQAGIPTVTMEAGEPMRLQRDMVEVGVNEIMTLMAKSGMYSGLDLWMNRAPAFYDSAWVRANASGILFSSMELGAEVASGDILGVISDPISNAQHDIVSPYKGRILGMALDQFVMPGFAVYHIGIHATKGSQAQSPDGEDGPEDDAYGSELPGEPADTMPPQDPGAAVLRADDKFDDE
ncbi:MAG: succinylglutamate desuccinylase/aspartoacylase family protein [Pseudomonadales bacterium]|nr:succinylglutamate desuccinylase/aspartoacylase family protein [Pseudomonadales bacterium]